MRTRAAVTYGLNIPFDVKEIELDDRDPRGADSTWSCVTACRGLAADRS
jgi:hypothetical protein